jgi:tRNA(Ile)-lysidine synthase
LTPARTDIEEAARSVPVGRWAVAVSGGADSVALLFLLIRQRPDLSLHIVHLDHETRAGASADDARFVLDLAARFGLPCTIATRSEIEATLDRHEPNRSARFRAARLALFRKAVAEHGLSGVLVAHHADDQAETILHRLLRGSGPAGLAGMRATHSVGGVLLCRPLLKVRRDTLRVFLREIGESWREDASNESAEYLRNRLRALFSREPSLIDVLLRLGRSCRDVRAWIHARTPEPSETIRAGQIVQLPDPLQRELARRWLARAGVPEDRIDPGAIARLIMMADDVASAPRQHFPGDVLVRRARGALSSVRPNSG